MGGVESGEFLWLLLSSVRGQTRWWGVCRRYSVQDERRAAQSSARRRRWKAVCEEECRAGFGLLRGGGSAGWPGRVGLGQGAWQKGGLGGSTRLGVQQMLLLLHTSL